MITIGFAIQKGKLWYTVLEGDSKDTASIKKNSFENFNAESEIGSLMSDFYKIFSEILTENEPDKIFCKAHLNSNLKQISYMQYPCGILAYLAKTKDIQIEFKSTRWIGPEDKGRMLICKNFFSSHKLTKEKLATTLLAWHAFE